MRYVHLSKLSFREVVEGCKGSLFESVQCFSVHAGHGQIMTQNSEPRPYGLRKSLLTTLLGELRAVEFDRLNSTE